MPRIISRLAHRYGMVAGSCTFSINYTVATGPPTLSNQAEAICNIGSAETTADSVIIDVPIFSPTMTVEKTGPDSAKAGDSVTYGYTITNIVKIANRGCDDASVTKGSIQNTISRVTGYAKVIVIII